MFRHALFLSALWKVYKVIIPYASTGCTGFFPKKAEKKSALQNAFYFVILRNEVTKDLSFEGFCKLFGKDPSLARTLALLSGLPLGSAMPFRRMTRILQRARI